MKYIMARNGRSLTLSESSNSAESEPKRFWLFFLCGGCAEINKKKYKKIGKNNRGLGKIRHFVGVEKIKKRESI